MSQSEDINPDDTTTDEPESGEDRRTFLSVFSSVLMAFGLTGGYGMFVSLAVRFLFPSRELEKRSMFVGEVSSFAPGQSFEFQSPDGRAIAITRRNENSDVDAFIALSSICPHLGCQVHWELQNNRYFCPCHNGAFDAEGVATEGPPLDARQTLARYPLKIENNLLFIEVPIESLVQSETPSSTSIASTEPEDNQKTEKLAQRLPCSGCHRHVEAATDSQEGVIA